MNTKIVTEYLHGERDEHSELWSVDAEQQNVFRYALYEVAIGLEVDMDTGKSRIVSVDGVDLVTKGEFE